MNHTKVQHNVLTATQGVTPPLLDHNIVAIVPLGATPVM